jgi:hypothetical protein
MGRCAPLVPPRSRGNNVHVDRRARYRMASIPVKASHEWENLHQKGSHSCGLPRFVSCRKDLQSHLTFLDRFPRIATEDNSLHPKSSVNACRLAQYADMIQAKPPIGERRSGTHRSHAKSRVRGQKAASLSGSANSVMCDPGGHCGSLASALDRTASKGRSRSGSTYRLSVWRSSAMVM